MSASLQLDTDDLERNPLIYIYMNRRLKMRNALRLNNDMPAPSICVPSSALQYVETKFKRKSAVLAREMASRPKSLKSLQFALQQVVNALRQTEGIPNGIGGTLADSLSGRTRTLPTRSLVLKLFGLPLGSGTPSWAGRYRRRQAGNHTWLRLT